MKGEAVFHMKSVLHIELFLVKNECLLGEKALAKKKEEKRNKERKSIPNSFLLNIDSSPKTGFPFGHRYW